MKTIYFYIIFLLGSFALWAQEVTAHIDSTHIQIGSSFTLTLEAHTAKGAVVQFPAGDHLGPFEVLESRPVDTVLQDQKTAYLKKYVLTQFDSGRYKLPQLAVLINGQSHATTAFDVQVNNVKVDTLKQPMFDIKANAGSTTDTSKWPYYATAFVLSVLIGFLVYWLIKRRQNQHLTEEDLYRTPLEKVTKKLEELDAKRLIIAGDVKTYYSEITYITRDYIEEVFEIPAKELTSSELIRLLTLTIKNKKIKLNKEAVVTLKKVLQTADLVKFAKSEPSFIEIESDRKATEQLSITIDQALPRFAEEQSTRVRLREQRFRKRKRMRTLIPIAVTSFLILLTGAFYLYQSFNEGFNFSFLQSNKSLYKKEWIKSSYGYPALQIETPEALVRLAPTSTAKQEQQSQAQFMYNNAITNLTINVATTAGKAEENTDIEDIYKRKIKALEAALGAKNVQSEVEKFNLEGVEGLHSAGSFTRVAESNGKEQQFQFELYVLLHPEGVQEISVIYPLDDAYGQKIAQRVLESIEIAKKE